jgi:hypothetical protein
MSKVNDRNEGFAEGTTVLMANGGLKPIEKIQPGEWVMSFDTSSSSSELEPREVIDTFKHIIRDVLEVQSGEDSMIVARGQLFLAPNADWHFAHETAAITDVNGNPREFTVTKVIGGKHKIYDIIVDTNHSLVANGFRVHNPSSSGIGGTSGGSTSFGNTPVGGGLPAAKDKTSANTTGKSYSTTMPKDSPYASGGSQSKYNANQVAAAKYANMPSNGNKDEHGGAAWGIDNSPSKSSRSSKSATPKAKPAPAPDKKVLAYTAYLAIQETMDYICDVQITYLGTSYFTVRTAVSNYMKYADALAKDALAHVLNSTMGQSDKNNLQAFHEDITNVFTIIRNSWATPDDTAVNLESIKRACLNVKQFIDRSTGVIGKYIGSQAPTLKYTVPGLPAPGVVQLPTNVQSPLYVKTTANTWVTTAPSASGTTTTPPTTGGVGASYTKTRVVRGYLYSYTPGRGWGKVGPADQYRDLS